MIRETRPTTKQRVSNATFQPTTGHVPRAEVVSLSQADIARRAYEIYLRSGRVSGRCLQNWYEADRELRHEALRDALMPETSTDASTEDRYSELLNGRNPRGDSKLMRAITEAKPGTPKRTPPKSKPNGQLGKNLIQSE